MPLSQTPTPTVASDRAGLPLIQRLFDQLPSPTAYWDPDLRNVIANRAYCSWFGLTPETLRGMHASEVLGERIFTVNRPYFAGALAGTPQVFERSLEDAEGRTRHTKVSYIPDLVDGELRGLFVQAVDLTELVEARRSLDEAQELAGVGSWSYTLADQSVHWSRQLYRIAGKDPATFSPTLHDYLELIHPADRARVEAVRAEHASRGEGYDVRYRILSGTKVRHVHSRSRPDRNAAGEVVALRGTIQDETRLHRQAAELEDTNQLLSDTIGMLGHDVRNPLAVVLGHLDMMREDWESTPEDVLRRQVDTTFGAAQRLSRLVDDILVMVNLDSGQLAARRTEEDLATLVARIVSEEIYPCNVDLQVTGSALVLVDVFHVRQVLANLVTNAARYGAPPVTVEVSAPAGAACVAVSDLGEGVPEEFRPRLFERFTRAESGVAATTSGTGFGLHIVKALVEANGGTIAYGDNAPGARFTVTLPAR